MQIAELLNAPYAFTLHIYDDEAEAFIQLPGGDSLDINFDIDVQNDAARTKILKTQFVRNASTKISGEGDAPRVLSTVVAVLREAVAKIKPDLVYFSAQEPNRASLYRRAVSKVLPGWKDISRSALAQRKLSDDVQAYFARRKDSWRTETHFLLVRPSLLSEMAAPSTDIKNQRFYHGHSGRQIKVGGAWIRDSKGQEIADSGIIIAPAYTQRGFQTPVSGRAYFTTDLEYAVIYALGGVMAGHEFHESSDPYGWLFVINGSEFSDVQPDEDSIGEMLSNYTKKKPPDWLVRMAHAHITPKRLSRAMNGESHVQSVIGKQLLTKMSDHQKLELIVKYGMHISNLGNVRFSEAWRLDKKAHQKNLKSDGSNFFDFAERIV